MSVKKNKTNDVATELNKLFSESLDLADEMKSIPKMIGYVFVCLLILFVAGFAFL